MKPQISVRSDIDLFKNKTITMSGILITGVTGTTGKPICTASIRWAIPLG